MSKDPQTILTIVGTIGGVLMAILALGYLSGNFVPALVCIGVICFIGFCGYGMIS